MNLFPRFFFGFMIQALPFGALCLYPFWDKLSVSKAKILWILPAALAAEAMVFSGISCGLAAWFADQELASQIIQIVFIAMLAVSMAVYRRMVKTHWQHQLFVFLFAANGALVATSLLNVCLSYISGPPDPGALPYSGAAIPGLAVMALAVVPPMAAVLKSQVLPLFDCIGTKVWNMLSLITLCLFLAFSVGVAALNDTDLVRLHTILLLFALSISELSAYYFILRFINVLLEKEKSENLTRQLRQQVELQQDQYKRISLSIAVSRKARHDARHHIILLAGLLKEERFGEAQEYIEQYFCRMEEQDHGKLCDNYVADTLLRYYLRAAETAGIPFKYRVYMEGRCRVGETDLTVLLGNLLENALEAQDRLEEEEPFIHFTIGNAHDRLIITVDNRFNGQLRKKGEELLSSKTVGGVGLKCVRDIVRQYGGAMEVRQEKDIFMVSISI